MPDICDLVLDDHETLRRRFAELDERKDSEPAVLGTLWAPVADLLDLHAAVEEEVFYPTLLDTGTSAHEETEDAIDDHNAIRDAVARSRDAEPGSQVWWDAVAEAREQNSEHMGEEERGALADLRTHADKQRREELGARWIAFRQEHAGLRGLQIADRDAKEYIDEHE